ncbi:methylmalonyl-CoA mutase [Egibacter rhizosphaerae]|uniref:Methylmalonyl-CoA mutase n=1 Tax=Egibacter rhizosphaerae TaxID=1670831 RepID=A0A411YBP7_9ACTN|nr:methylmalonyl-CoA mutase family protein [Egibacter rhizosphaerae]QBI18634.1 methylmalonyl-CoA mutase [Egibacter rhizosphaerae]
MRDDEARQPRESRQPHEADERQGEQLSLASQAAAWEEAFDRSLEARGVDPQEEREAATTLSDVEVPPLVGPHNYEVDHERIGFPGQFPYTRGVYPSMYRGRPWTIRQFAGFGSVEDTNQRYHELLAAGQHGLSVAFDMPTLMGRDSDEPESEGEVGHCGVAVDTLGDMERLFDRIPLGEITTSMTINGPAPVLFAMYCVAAERQGYEVRQLGGTLQTDIFKEYIAQKEWLFPPEPHLKLIGDLMEFTTAEMPRYHPISISGYHIREAGSTAAQELAFTLAAGFAYVELGQSRGLDVDDFGPRLSFFFDAHIDFFEEIAKFRAGRRIWARWLRDRYGATAEKAMLMRFHTQTAGVSLTAQQPDNNVVRTAVEALAAVMGGTQSLHTNALDEVLALPTEHAAKVALRTQQVIAEETGVPNTIDPLGGSWFVEWMTDKVEEDTEAYLAQILDRSDDGTVTRGMLAGIESGWFMSEIADAAFRYQQHLEKGTKHIVGVTSHVEDDDEELEILRISGEVERAQEQRLVEHRADRDGALVEDRLEALRAACRSDENLMPVLMDAVRADATMGEICQAMKDVYGEYREPPVI